MVQNFSWLIPNQIAGAGQPGAGGFGPGLEGESLAGDLQLVHAMRGGSVCGAVGLSQKNSINYP